MLEDVIVTRAVFTWRASMKVVSSAMVRGSLERKKARFHQADMSCIEFAQHRDEDHRAIAAAGQQHAIGIES
jgi:hypothetical protein